MASKVKGGRRTSRLSSKNQITIPVAALREARIESGDELVVTVDAVGRLRLDVVRSPLDALIGAGPRAAGAVGLDELRDEWER